MRQGNFHGEVPALGVQANQEKIDAWGSTWLTWSDGRIVEGFDTWNMGAMMARLRMAEKRLA